MPTRRSRTLRLLTGAKLDFTFLSLLEFVQPVQLGTSNDPCITIFPPPVWSVNTKLPAPSLLLEPAERIAQECPPAELLTSSDHTPSVEEPSSLNTRKTLLSGSITFSLVSGLVVPIPTKVSVVFPLESVREPNTTELLLVTFALEPRAVALLMPELPLVLKPRKVLELSVVFEVPELAPRKIFCKPAVLFWPAPNPTKTFCTPEVLSWPAAAPINVLSLPLFVAPAAVPTATLPFPVVLLFPESKPTNVLEKPVVFFCPAVAPRKVLSAPVGLAAPAERPRNVLVVPPTPRT